MTEPSTTPKETYVQVLLDLSFSSLPEASNNETKLSPSFGGWEDNDITAALSVSSSSSHSSLSQSSNQSLSSKSGSQINSTRTTNALRPKSSSYLAIRSGSGTVKSLIRGYIETEPIPYKFEHHDVNMMVLHMDRYRKVYTYPNMEKSMENQSLAGTSAATRSVYSTALVRPKLFVFREGREPRRTSRKNQVKQFYRHSSPQSTSDLNFTEQSVLSAASNTNSFSSINDPLTQSSSSSINVFSDLPKRPYSTLRTQYRTSLLESSSVQDKNTATQYRHKSVPLAYPITASENSTKKECSKTDRTFSLKSTITSRGGGEVDNMTWYPERSSTSPLVITPVKTSSLCLCTPTPAPTSPLPRDTRKPSNNATKRDSKLCIDTRTIKVKVKSQQAKNRTKMLQSNNSQNTFPFKKYDRRTLNSPTIPLLVNETSRLTAKPATRSGQTLLLGHRYQVNFRSKQPAFRYETHSFQGHMNSHGSSQPISIASGPWISQY